MKPHLRILKTIMWGSATVTVLLAAIWIGSGWWSVARFNSNWYIGVGTGGIYYGTFGATPWRLPAWDVRPIRGVNSANQSFHLVHVPQFDADGWFIPLWPAIGIGLLATYSAWRVGHRARRHPSVRKCPKCKYELSGLGEGSKCPECGNAASNE